VFDSMLEVHIGACDCGLGDEERLIPIARLNLSLFLTGRIFWDIFFAGSKKPKCEDEHHREIQCSG